MEISAQFWDHYLWFKDLELTAAPGPAEQFTSISRGDTSILGDPLFHFPIFVQVVETVVLLTLLLSETLSFMQKMDQNFSVHLTAFFKMSHPLLFQLLNCELISSFICGHKLDVFEVLDCFSVNVHWPNNQSRKQSKESVIFCRL